jgi:thiol-disulfide isomerase/thioredoxin
MSAIAALAWVSAALPTRTGAAEPSADAKTGEIVVRVIDGASAAQPAAVVSLFVFDNKAQLYKVACPDVKSDLSGNSHFKRLSAENVYYVIRAKAAEGLVGYLGCTLDSKKARQEVNVVVLPPASGVLEVRDESGKPVSGASIWSITHSGPNGTMWFALGSLLKVCELSTTASDDRGELGLPDLPAGKIDIKLIHPDFAPCELKGISVDQRRNAVHAIMTRGITLTLRVNGDGKGTPVEGLSIALDHEPYEHPSTISGRLPSLRTDGLTHFTVATGRYTSFRLEHPDYFITPIYSMLRGHGVADEAECIELNPGNDRFTFQLHRKVKVRGRVLDASNGKPVAGQGVQGELPSNAGQTPLARFAKEWSPAGSADTNDHGEFEMDLAAGPARLKFAGHGFLSQLRHYPIDVAADGSTVAPDILVRPVPKVRGVVQDQNGKPLPGAIVRFRGSLLTYACQPTVTDGQGRFELAPPWIPIDFQTEEPIPDQVVVAWQPLDPLAAEARIDLRKASGALDNVELRMEPQDYGQLVTGYPDDLTPWARGIIPPDQKDHLAAISLVGKPAPELDGAAWLNTDKPMMSLADFRGKYVLLQFWATWCGPCHREMPTVKLAYELYKDKGLVVIGVHDNSMPLEAIKDDVAKSGLSYPIVADNPDGRIFATYREHGMADAYPTYALIDPDGNVLLDDATVAGPSLSSFKVEIIRQLLMTRGTTHR